MVEFEVHLEGGFNSEALTKKASYQAFVCNLFNKSKKLEISIKYTKVLYYYMSNITIVIWRKGLLNNKDQVEKALTLERKYHC